jgi:hypothetical protein
MDSTPIMLEYVYLVLQDAQNVQRLVTVLNVNQADMLRTKILKPDAYVMNV